MSAHDMMHMIGNTHSRVVPTALLLSHDSCVALLPLCAASRKIRRLWVVDGTRRQDSAATHLFSPKPNIFFSSSERATSSSHADEGDHDNDVRMRQTPSYYPLSNSPWVSCAGRIRLLLLLLLLHILQLDRLSLLTPDNRHI